MAGPEKHLPEETQKAFDDARDQLLTIHKALLDHERARYEKKHGAIGSVSALLQLVIDHPWFLYLKQLSALITEMDEFTASKTPPPTLEGARAILAQAQRLLSPNESGSHFQQSYLKAIQDSPDIAYLHGEWKKRSKQESSAIVKE